MTAKEPSREAVPRWRYSERKRLEGNGQFSLLNLLSNVKR